MRRREVLALTGLAGLAGCRGGPRTHPTPGAPSVAADPGRTRAVTALLDARAAAWRVGDESAWLGTVDPTDPAFLTRQRDQLRRLRQAPLDELSYTLTGGAQPGVPAGSGRPGEQTWQPSVALLTRIHDVDLAAVSDPQAYTFVERRGRWLLAATDDATGQPGMWDFGDVGAVHRPGLQVLHHPGWRRQALQVADLVEEGLPVVSAVWGRDWPRRVTVLLAASQREAAALSGRRGEVAAFAALATTGVADPGVARHTGAAPARITVNPGVFFDGGTPLTRRIVLRHELTHLATAAATTTRSPLWLVEGLADVVGFLGIAPQVRSNAPVSTADVRAGRLPQALPSDAAFDSAGRALAAAYEQAWLACRHLAVLRGRPGLVRAYRAVGAGASVDEAVGGLAAFTASWIASLQELA